MLAIRETIGRTELFPDERPYEVYDAGAEAGGISLARADPGRHLLLAGANDGLEGGHRPGSTVVGCRHLPKLVPLVGREFLASADLPVYDLEESRDDPRSEQAPFVVFSAEG